MADNPVGDITDYGAAFLSRIQGGGNVAKVEELTVFCDRLDAQLTTTQTESRRLLEAVLYEALAPAV